MIDVLILEYPSILCASLEEFYLCSNFYILLSLCWWSSFTPSMNIDTVFTYNQMALLSICSHNVKVSRFSREPIILVYKIYNITSKYYFNDPYGD